MAPFLFQWSVDVSDRNEENVGPTPNGANLRKSHFCGYVGGWRYGCAFVAPHARGSPSRQVTGHNDNVKFGREALSLRNWGTHLLCCTPPASSTYLLQNTSPSTSIPRTMQLATQRRIRFKASATSTAPSNKCSLMILTNGYLTLGSS